MKTILCALALCAAFAMTAAADAPKKSDPATDAAMAEMMKYANPGPKHALLKPMAGTWDAVVKSWVGPGDPVTSKGVMKNEMTLGGRYLESKYKGEFQGAPFDGYGLTGYDIKAGKLISLWTDTMSTTWMTSSGDFSADGKEIVTTGTMDGPDGKPMAVRMVTRLDSPDKHVYTMYGQANGQEAPVMEITYTRKK